MGAYNKILSVGVQAASLTNICLSQSLAAPGALLLNGSTGGVLNYASQVIISFAGNETGHNFIVTGTLSNGQVTQETLAGTNETSATTVNNYLTVNSITGPATTSTVTVGTNAVGNSQVYIVDKFVNPAVISVACVVTGSINFSVQNSYDDLAASGYDLVNGGTVTWFSQANLTSQAANTSTVINGPITMLRVLQNSGTGSVSVTVNTPMGDVG